MTIDVGAARKLILSRGDFIASEEMNPKYTSLEHSMGLACVLGLSLKEKGLGSIGVAMLLLDKKPVSAFTSLGFTPVDKEKVFTRGEGSGLLLGVEGASQLENWPMKEYSQDGPYTVHWTSVDRHNPAWKKLRNHFPEAGWQDEARATSDALVKEHEELIKQYWISFIG